MEFDVTREQWVNRFVMRLSQLEAGADPAEFVLLAQNLWPSRGQVAPESAADAEFAARTAVPRDRFERTERIPSGRDPSADEYVRDNDEWVARCLARVLELDPIIRADEARASVVDLAALERWRLMKPERAAEQLYTPIRVKPS